MAGLADTKGHLTKTYQYTVTGELDYGSATYENEYTYNGESYNSNIHIQYLRARYYSVVTASFLTEASYLGNIREPLTLNRYNYCISSYLNYVDPSGNFPLLEPLDEKIMELEWRMAVPVIRDKIKEDFTVTKWGKDKYGKSYPVEWRAPNGAEVSVDIGHSIQSGAPTADHVGWQIGGKRSNGGGVRGHIFVDEVPYNR